MKIEVRCRGCSTRYLVEETDGELLCPACGASIAIGGDASSGDVDDAVSTLFDRPTVPAPAQDAPAATVTRAVASGAAPDARAGATVASPAAEAVAATESIAADAEVVCPRCKLHFVPRRAAGTPAPEERKVVLIVEDMNYFRQVAADALSEEYEIRTASSVDEAHARLRDGPVDLMILDLTLDGGEFGFDLLRGLASKPCPILIFTAKDESEIYGAEWDELRGLGADDIVIKGMNVGDVLPRKVGALLGKTWDDDD